MGAIVKKSTIHGTGSARVETSVVKLICYVAHDEPPPGPNSKKLKEKLIAQNKGEFKTLIKNLGGVVMKCVQEETQINDFVHRFSNGFESKFDLKCSAWEIHLPMHEYSLAGLQENIGFECICYDVHMVDTHGKVPYVFKKNELGHKRTARSKGSEPQSVPPKLVEFEGKTRIDYCEAGYSHHKKGKVSPTQIDSLEESRKASAHTTCPKTKG